MSSSPVPKPSTPNAEQATAGHRWHVTSYEYALFAFVVAYAVIAAWFCILRAQELFARSADLGAFMQAFWSYNHGAGFFESLNYGDNQITSLFALHPAPLLYVLALFYRFFPSASALLMLQAAAVGAAAIPLFYLTRDLTDSNPRALAAAGLYLVWVPVLSGNMFDFHLEAFLPLGTFTLVLLMARRQYLLAILPAIFTICTVELGPIIAGLIGVFFLLPPLRATLESARLRWRAGGSGRKGRDFLRAAWKWLGAEVRKARVIASVVLIVGSVVSYFILRILETQAGLGPSTTAKVTSGPLWYYPIHTILVHLTITSLVADPFVRVEYWALLFALVAFLPFFAPRTFIISGPWIFYTLTATINSFTLLGVQYGIVSASMIFIGVAYGLNVVGPGRAKPVSAPAAQDGTGSGPPSAEPPSGPSGDPYDTLAKAAQALHVLLDMWSTTGSRPDPDPTELSGKLVALAQKAEASARTRPASRSAAASSPQPAAVFLPRKGSRPLGGMLTAAVIVVVAVNVLLSPANPYIPSPGAGSPGYSFTLQWGEPPGYPALQRVAALIPAEATALASPNLFPLIANDVHAYTLGTKVKYYVFNTTNPPAYVYIDENWLSVLPSFSDAMLWNSSDYGVVASVGTPPSGGVTYLFGYHYPGPTLNLRPPPEPMNVTFYPTSLTPARVTAGAVGVVSANNTTAGGYAIRGLSGHAGTIWKGGPATLPAGTTNFTVFVAVHPVGKHYTDATPALNLTWKAWNLTSTITLDYSAFAGQTGWVPVTLTVTVPYPLIEFQFIGTAPNGQFVTTLNYYALTFSD